jgi:hypothetical protein
MFPAISTCSATVGRPQLYSVRLPHQPFSRSMSVAGKPMNVKIM